MPAYKQAEKTWVFEKKGLAFFSNMCNENPLQPAPNPLIG